MANERYYEDKYGRRPDRDPSFEPGIEGRARRIISEGYNPDNPEELEAYRFRILGISPFRGSLLENRAFEGNREKSSSKYSNFLEAAKGINVSDLGAEAETKKRLLETHFPGMFKGRQPLGDYNNAQIGALFRSFVDYSKHSG